MLLDGDEEHNRIENNTIEKNITNGEGELLAAFASYIEIDRNRQRDSPYQQSSTS